MARLSFGRMTGTQQSKFFSDLRRWEEMVKDKYLNAPMVNDENFVNVTSKSINMRSMLAQIPINDRENLMREYGRIIGWDQHVPAGTIPNFLEEARQSEHSRSWRFMLNPKELSGPNANPLAIIYNRMYPNLNTSAPDAGLKFSMNIMSADYLEHGLLPTAQTGAHVGAGKRILVFDTETAGLAETSGVRQVSAKMVNTTTDATGKVAFNVEAGGFNKYFDTARMHLGFLADETGAIPMTDWLKKNGAIPSGDMGIGADFANAMKPFLQSVTEADYIAGHNIGFDIDQIFKGLASTGVYKDNVEGFGDLLDQARGILDRKGSVIDTLHLASTQLPDLALDPLLAIEHSGRHSLANLMLQTDLYDKLKIDVPDIDAKLGIGTNSMMHDAAIDAEIEAHLLRHLHEGTLSARSASNKIPTAVRAAVLRSYAPTPITKITDPRHIDKALLSELYSEGVSPHGPYNVTPLEQEMWKTRKFGTTAEVVDETTLMQGLGDWRRYTLQDVPYQGWLNRGATLFKRGLVPSHESFAALQDKMAAKGIPFAGLSRPERWLSVSMSQAASHRSSVNRLLGVEDKRLVELGENLGISRWAAQTDSYISDRVGKNISLPPEILQEAERQGKLTSNLGQAAGSDLEMLRFSAFETQKGHRVNLIYKFKSKEEAQSLSDWLVGLDRGEKIFDKGTKSLADYGFNNLEEIAAALPDSGVRHGIGIAFLDDRAAQHAYNAAESFTGGILRDADAIPMSAGLAGIEGGVVKVGAFHLDRFGGAARKVGYARELALAVSREKDVLGILGSAPKTAAARAFYSSPEATMGIVEKSWNAYRKVSSHAPLIAGAAAVATGIWAWHRHKEKTEAGDQTVIDPMPIESNRDYYNYRRELSLGPAPASRRPDPLLTAGVVGNLDRTKIGHTLMGTNKYNNLYGGVL